MVRKNETPTTKLANWLIQTLEARGTVRGKPLSFAQLFVVYGQNERMGTVRWALKSAQYYTTEKAEELAGDWVEAAQQQADGLAEHVTTVIELFETENPHPVEQSLPWRTETASPQAQVYPANDKGSLAIMQKMCTDLARTLTVTLPTLTQQAMQFGQHQNERYIQSQKEQEEARRMRDEAESSRHEREMERLQLAARLENQREFVEAVKPAIPLLRAAIGRKLIAMGQKPDALPAAGAPAENQNQSQPTPQPTNLQKVLAEMTDEQRDKLSLALVETFDLEQIQAIGAALGISP